MNGAKKTWRKPELIVLVRSNPEEAVLTGCKVSEKRAGPFESWCTLEEEGKVRCREILGT